MYKIIKSILNSNVNWEKDLINIKNRLVNIDNNNEILELYEIEAIWEWFSGTQCASFLIVNDKSFGEFIDWLEEENYDESE